MKLRKLHKPLISFLILASLALSFKPAKAYIYDDYGDDFDTADIMTSASIDGYIDYSGDVDYFQFTPTQSGYYTIEDALTGDTNGYLYDSNQNYLMDNDDADPSIGRLSFSIEYYLTANQTYYISVGSGYYSDFTGEYNLIITCTVPGFAE